MIDIKSVLYTALECMNTRLDFGSFSFTIFQYFLFMLVLGIIVHFIKSVME